MATYASDPAPVRGGTKRRSGWMSLPIVVILICAVSALPPVASRLTALDSTLHAHNDVIVHYLLMVGPFALLAVAILALVWMLSGSKPTPPKQEEADAHWAPLPEGKSRRG